MPEETPYLSQMINVAVNELQHAVVIGTEIKKAAANLISLLLTGASQGVQITDTRAAFN